MIRFFANLRQTSSFRRESVSSDAVASGQYVGDTTATQQILEGTYVFSPDTDPATRLLLEEAAITYASMSTDTDEVLNYVSVSDFQLY